MKHKLFTTSNFLKKLLVIQAAISKLPTNDHPKQKSTKHKIRRQDSTLNCVSKLESSAWNLELSQLSLLLCLFFARTPKKCNFKISLEKHLTMWSIKIFLATLTSLSIFTERGTPRQWVYLIVTCF